MRRLKNSVELSRSALTKCNRRWAVEILPATFRIMDKTLIEENIIELENSDTTFENVQELAYLYIIRDKLFTVADKTEKELSEILPAYEKYIDAKRKFQMKQSDDEQIIYYFNLTCEELKDFICSLYSGTSTRKERQSLINLLYELYNKFND